MNKDPGVRRVRHQAEPGGDTQPSTARSASMSPHVAPPLLSLLPLAEGVFSPTLLPREPCLIRMPARDVRAGRPSILTRPGRSRSRKPRLKNHPGAFPYRYVSPNIH
jgi:hypothetical protein